MKARRMQTGESFFDAIRKSKDATVEMSVDSSVIKVNGDMRLGHLTQLMTSTEPHTDENGKEMRNPVDYLVYQQAAAFMAMNHFNERKSAVVPGLSNRLESCDFYFTMNIADTRDEILYASRNFFSAVAGKHSLSTPHPTGVVGDYASSVSKPLAVLGGAYQVPQISPSATSSDLDKKAEAPLFARTVPTNAGDSNAVVAYLKSLGVTHFAIIFVRDSFGTAYHSALISAASGAQITVLSSPFEDTNENSMRSAVKLVAEREYKYVFAIVTENSWKVLLREAYNLGIAGNSEHVWMFGEGLQFIDRAVDPRKDPEIAAALDGTGFVMLQVPMNNNLADALEQFRSDTEIQSNFIAIQEDPSIFYSYNISAVSITTGPFQHTNYDAVIAFGIAACEAKSEFFTGQELYDQIKSTTFDGASGRVSFDPLTGTRRSETVNFLVSNMVKNQQLSTADSIKFDVFPSIEVEGATIHVLKPFVYAGNGWVHPQSLPTNAMEMNLIPIGLRIFGWLLAGLVILLSSWFIWWTIRHRKKSMIRASQPIFLCQLCVGTIIMASSIIPLSLQEPVKGLDASCMAIPWLFTTGFVTSFSGLLAKQWRINKIFRTSGEMRRTEIKAKDAMWMCGLLLAVNYVVLLAWTLVAPLQWTRVPMENFDSFGRSVESYGTCWYTESSSQSTFLIVLFAINMLLVCFANYQSFLAKNIPSDFNESLYVALSMASILEATILGIPIIFMVIDSPSAAFVVASLFITILCLAILLPLFIPKYVARSKVLDKAKLSEHWSLKRRSLEPAAGGGSVAAIRASIRLRESQQALDMDSSFNASAPFQNSQSELASSVSDLLANIARKKSLVVSVNDQLDNVHVEPGMQDNRNTVPSSFKLHLSTADKLLASTTTEEESRV